MVNFSISVQICVVDSRSKLLENKVFRGRGSSETQIWKSSLCNFDKIKSTMTPCIPWVYVVENFEKEDKVLKSYRYRLLRYCEPCTEVVAIEAPVYSLSYSCRLDRMTFEPFGAPNHQLLWVGSLLFLFLSLIAQQSCPSASPLVTKIIRCFLQK